MSKFEMNNKDAHTRFYVLQSNMAVIHISQQEDRLLIAFFRRDTEKTLQSSEAILTSQSSSMKSK